MNIILAGGGTAGHINPALTVAKTVKSKNPGSKILFVGNRGSLEEKLVKKAGFDIEYVKVEGLRRSFSIKTVKTMQMFFKAVSDCKKIIRDFKADMVVGTGGYVSAPAVYAAHLLGVKSCIHEQNAYPGITSKFLSRYADCVFISFESSRKYFSKAKNIVLSGNPLDEAFLFCDKKSARQKLGIPRDAFYVLSFAGSLGAREINKLFIDFIVKNDKAHDFVHTHATGAYGYKWMPDELAVRGFDIHKKTDTRVEEYIYDMPQQMAACDLVISRAGAITIGEIMAQGKPSILIPSPNVTHNHQYHNAMSLVDNGAAMILEEKDATADKLYSMALSVKNDPALAARIGENAGKMAQLRAAEVIYRNMYDIIKQ